MPTTAERTDTTTSLIVAALVKALRPRNRKTLTLRRKGNFTIRTTGQNHCGVKETLNIRYSVLVECEALLDKRGFLFDQLSVDKYFQSIESTDDSCERLVMSCAQDLVRVIKSEHPRCGVRRIVMELEPEPYLASMTYTLENTNAAEGNG